MLTPLETVTQGMNLLYATGRVDKGTRNDKIVHARSGGIQVSDQAELVSSLPKIDNRVNYHQEDYMSD